MAIEFNCPYCSATIRVPDAYAGKQGRCPKCDTKLLIPCIPVPNPLPGAGPSAAVSPPQLSPVSSGAASSQAPDPTSNELGDNDKAPADPFDVRPVTTSIAKSRRRRARLRPSRTLVIGVPVICFLVLFGIIAYSLTGSLPQLHGKLIGHRLEDRALPEETILWSEVNLSPDDRAILQKALTTNPESLISQFVACRLSASDNGILVELAAQPECQWVVVDVSSEKPLAIWRRKEGPQWNQMRLSELRVAVNRYARDKLLKVDGKQIAIDPVATRDKVALTASCDALGYVIQAIADSAIFPCAAEDDFGKLYFCLPKPVQYFTIQGRTLADGVSGFNGEYSVAISSDKVTTEPIPVVDESVPEPSIPEGAPEFSDEKPVVPTPSTELKD